MSKKIDYKEVLKPALILFAICLIVAAALAGTNALTADKIAQAAAQAEVEARSQVFKGVSYELICDDDVTVYAVLADKSFIDGAVPAKSDTDASASDTSATDAEPAYRVWNGSNQAAPAVKSDSDILTPSDIADGTLYQIGYVATASSKGYGGDVDVMIGLDFDGKITGVTILDNSETAGLGANCTKEEWLAQFVGMSGTLSVKKDGGDVDALTSATITSRAVCSAINKASDKVKEIEGGRA